MLDRPNHVRRFLIALVFLAIVAIPFRGLLTRHWLASAFAEEDLARYESLFDFYERPLVGPGQSYRTGKVIVVVPEVWQMYREGASFVTQIEPERVGKKVERVANRHIDDDWFRLAPELRAATPDEVDTVILCEFSTRVEGYYVREGESAGAPGDKARRRIATLKIYDLESQRLIGIEEVIGPKLKTRIEEFESHLGERPDLVDFIESLPMR